MTKKADIHKAGGIIIRNKRLLVERSKDKEFFIAPGGSVEPGETPGQALVRELREEFQITVKEDDIKPFGTFYAQAAGQEDKTVQMDVFTVGEWEGEPTPDNEVEEIRWITSTPPEDIKVGSIFEHEVLPRLKEVGLID
ncbi:MAG TPA: NUDIX domain-containing protein [Candidatus Saccharimonadales bacterium]|nr:NUDIX domain-containing protein [Candidatus Saccharimonadales bacterium]